jgi:hypothetical protein
MDTSAIKKLHEEAWQIVQKALEATDLREFGMLMDRADALLEMATAMAMPETLRPADASVH